MKRARRPLLPWVLTAALAAAFCLLAADTEIWKAGLALLFPGASELVFPRESVGSLVAEHLLLVAVSTALAAALGIGIGTLVTRGRGRAFLGIVGDLTALGQTVPPVAVLALSVPLLGFGAAPTVLALFLYGLLPILRNTVAGLGGVPPEVIEAARGMGMTSRQCLFKAELPLAIPVIMAGVRTAGVVNVGTAAIGAVVGAGGLGAPIISGLVRENPSFVTEGAVAAGLLALVVDQILARVESALGAVSR